MSPPAGPGGRASEGRGVLGVSAVDAGVLLLRLRADAGARRPPIAIGWRVRRAWPGRGAGLRQGGARPPQRAEDVALAHVGIAVVAVSISCVVYIALAITRIRVGIAEVSCSVVSIGCVVVGGAAAVGVVGWGRNWVVRGRAIVPAAPSADSQPFVTII